MKNHTLKISVFTGLSLLATALPMVPMQAKAAPVPQLQINGGLRFDSQGAGTPNTLSGYAFLPILGNERGDVFFAESYINWNIASDAIDSSIGSSTRLGYRWLTDNKTWIYGVNAGIDNRPFQAQNFLQAGVGIEALSRNLEFRINGYIPFSQTSNLYATAYNGAYGLVNDQLHLNRSRWFGTALGGIDAEVGTPIAHWKGGDLRLYAGYYYLDGDYVSGSSGVRARAELRLSNNISLGGTVSYDDIFQTQATGYVRLGFSPQQKPIGNSINEAEERFLAQRGLPVDRQRVIQVANQQVRDREAAYDPLTGKQWVVRCVGLNASAYTVRCGYGDLGAAVNAIGAPADVLLLANGTNSNLNGSSLRLPAGTSLSNGANAPVLATQGGFIPLLSVFGAGSGIAPQINNGILSIGSNTTIAGLSFNNSSITNYSTKNVLIANNNFVGSYTDNPGGVSARALPAINLNSISDVIISGNRVETPQVLSYASVAGEDGLAVCGNRTNETSATCLSGNAIRITNGSGLNILNNSIIGALDEGIRLDNANGIINIQGNRVTGMRMGPDSNMQAAIFSRQSSGMANINESDNTVSDNIEGRYSAGTNGNLLYDGTKKNVIDPIEIGLCRGRISFGNTSDLYGDGLYGDCLSGTAIMNLKTTSNILIPGSGDASRHNHDGIDFNVGQNGVFNFAVDRNYVNVLTGNPLTTDFRGTAQVTGSVTNNSFIAQKDKQDALDLAVSNSNLVLGGQSGSGLINVSANTIRVNGGSPVGITGYGYTQAPVAYTVNLDLPQSNYSVEIDNNPRGATTTGNFSKFTVNYAGGSQNYP